MQSNRPQGNIVVGQSGGPTSVINSSLVGVIDEARRSGAYASIIGAAFGVEGLLQDELIDLTAESPASLAMIRETPSAALGSNRYKLKPEDPEAVLDKLIALDARAFVYIGGNDSADTTMQVARLAADIGHELYVIGVPKTVDNDLVETDHCPGFGSAARYVSTAIRETGFDSESIASYPVKVIEIMGRHAGWLAAAGALAREDEGEAPHLVYVPERPIEFSRLVSDVRSIVKANGFCVISLAEGAKGPDGQFLTDSAASQIDAFGHRQMAGTGDILASLIERETGIRARCDRPGTLQRSGSSLASSTDRQEAFEVGATAVRAALNGETGQMVTIVRQSSRPYICTTGLSPVEKIANREKKLPSEYMNAEGNYPTEAFFEYARPLIGEALPSYVRLNKSQLID